MIHLQKMSPADFAAYIPSLIEGYARDMARNLDIPVEAALERSRKQVGDLLPQGVDTPNHLIYTLHVDVEAKKIGHLWVFLDDTRKSAFIYDIEIDEAHRGQGLGRAALQTIEVQLHEMGYQKLGLHVFGDNPAAIHLYQSQGFEVVGMNMQKKI